MSKSKISMEDILSKMYIILYKEEITYCCLDHQTIFDFFELCGDNIMIKQEDLVTFLRENESKIDKNKLLLVVANNYQKYIHGLKKELEFNANSNEYNAKLQYAENVLENIRKLSKDVNDIIGSYYYDEENDKFSVRVISRKTIFDDKKSNNDKKMKRFDEINRNSKFNQLAGRNEDDDYQGMEWLIQALLLTDLYEIFTDMQLGDCVRTMIMENVLMKDVHITREELNDLRINDMENYDKFIEENLDGTKIINDASKTLQEYIEYINFDKLLLIAAYRFIDGIEHRDLYEKDIPALRDTLIEILKLIENDKISLKCKLQDRRDSYNQKDVRLSVKDIKEYLKQFSNNSYITREEIRQYKQQIENGEISLCDIDYEKIDIIFSAKELEDIAILDDDNFELVSRKLQWDKQKILDKVKQKGDCSYALLQDLVYDKKISAKDIIELYMNGIAEIGQIHNIKLFVDFSEEISIDKLEQYYDIYEKQNVDEQKENINFNRYLALYKEIVVEDNKEVLESNSDKLMEHIVEGYKKEDREAYVQKVETYYKEGILTLNSIVEWDDEKIIERFYKDGLIDIKDIDELLKKQKLSFDFVNKKYTAEVFDKELDYDERLRILNTGFVAQDDIFKLFNQNLIFEADLAELAKKSIINQNDLDQLLENRTMEELEKQSSIKLGNLNMLEKRNNEIYSDNDDTKYVNNKKAKVVIDPNERMEFIGLFKARHAEAYLDEDNPFYNYEFYVIPDESGDIGLNSVVIAERYYEDKYTEEKFATGNATYFFKYKDLMVLSNMKKSEMTKERKNIVFTVNHFIATDKRDGTWAVKMIYNLAKTMLSDDLKDYSKENQAKIVLEKLATIYSHNEIMKLIDKADDIDSGKYLYYIEDDFTQDITDKHTIITDGYIGDESENDVADDNEVSVGDGSSVGDDETSVGDEQR